MSKQMSSGKFQQKIAFYRSLRLFISIAIFLSAVAAEAVTVSPPSCSAIQNAINGLPPQGGEVVLQPGTYTCTTAIVINRNNVQLRGIGFPTLFLANGANSPVLVIGQTITPLTATRSNIEVSNLKINGNRLNQTRECWGGTCDTGGTTYIRNSGIVLRRVMNVTIKDVSTDNARSGGLVSERVSRFVTVERLRATNNQFDGLAACQTEDSVFTGLFLYNNLYAGLSFDCGFHRNVISDSIIKANRKPGIFMRNSRDNVFLGLQIQSSGEDGIFLAKNTETGGCASGNTFSEIVVGNSARAGIRLNDECLNNLLVGSQLIANKGGGISEVRPGLLRVFGTIIRLTK